MSLHFKKDIIFNELSFIISVLFFNQYILETKMRKGEAVVTLFETKTKSQRNSTKNRVTALKFGMAVTLKKYDVEL